MGQVCGKMAAGAVLPLVMMGYAKTAQAGVAAEGKGAGRPNILLIIADDQGYGDCSVYPGHSPDARTPNIDRIAAGGVRFSNGYVTAPACSPSRTGLITGRYQERFDRAAGWHTSLPTAARTIAEHLREAGYATLMLGKNDFGQNLADKMRDRRYPMNHGYDHHLGFEAHAHDYFQLTADVERRTKMPHEDSANIGPLDCDWGRKEFSNAYTTEIFTQEAIDFAKKRQEEGKPFFIALAYNAVHDLVEQVPPRYLEQYGVKPIPAFDPDSGQTYKQYYNTYNHYGVVNEQEMRKYFLANLACLDENVGRVMGFLDESHLSENTLVVFISDNGGSPNAGGNNWPLRGAKYGTFEGGIRVPFLMRWPGQVPAGQVVDEPVISLDVLPTLAAAAGKPVGDEEQLDGVNLLPRVRAGEEKEKLAGRTLYWKFINRWAIRRGDWKLVKCLNKQGGGPHYSSWTILGPDSAEPQLFDLKADPAEQHDVAGEHPEVVKELTAQFKLWEGTNGAMSEEK